MPVNKRAEIEKRRTQVWDLYNKGISSQTIAKLLGVSRNTIVQDMAEIRKEQAARLTQITSDEESAMMLTQFENLYHSAMAEASLVPKEAFSQKEKLLRRAQNALTQKMNLLIALGRIQTKPLEVHTTITREGLDLKEMSVSELTAYCQRQAVLLMPQN